MGINSYRKQFVTLGVNALIIGPFLEGFCRPGKQIGSHISSLPLKIWQNMAEKIGICPYSLYNQCSR